MNNKVALVTGATKGIGQAIALKLAKDGYDIIINFHASEDKAIELRSLIQDMGQKAWICKANVANSEEVANMFKMIKEECGKLDVLVNNAGITKDNLILRMKEEEFDQVIATNLKGCFNCTKQAAKLMFKQKNGSIINISSVIGLIGNIGQVNYAASKAGILGITRSAAKELARYNVRVNAICPGFIETDMTKSLDISYVDDIIKHIALQRLGKPEDIANIVSFLAGDMSSYITGQTMCVDGGMVF